MYNIKVVRKQLSCNIPFFREIFNTVLETIGQYLYNHSWVFRMEIDEQYENEDRNLADLLLVGGDSDWHERFNTDTPKSISKNSAETDISYTISTCKVDKAELDLGSYTLYIRLYVENSGKMPDSSTCTTILDEISHRLSIFGTQNHGVVDKNAIIDEDYPFDLCVFHTETKSCPAG